MTIAIVVHGGAKTISDNKTHANVEGCLAAVEAGWQILQLLQWHHMFSSIKSDITVAGLELNTLGDGLFHLLGWVLTLIGIFLLWRAGKRQDGLGSGRAFGGALLIGTGLFNLVEGMIDHHLLGIHHLRPGPNQLLWDLGFLAVGALLVGIGLRLVQFARLDGEKGSPF